MAHRRVGEPTIKERRVSHMASPYKVEFGDMIECFRRLAEFGLDWELLQAIKQDSRIAQAMVCGGNTKLQGYDSFQIGRYPEQTLQTLVRGLFVPPDEQVELIRESNRRWRWGFTEEDFSSLGDPPIWPRQPLGVTVLVPYFETVQQTYLRLVGAIRGSYGREEVNMRGLRQFRASYLELHVASNVDHTPGLRWERIDLGASLSTEEREQWLQGELEMPAAGVLAAVLHFPRWVANIGQNLAQFIPPVCLGGWKIEEPTTGNYWLRFWVGAPHNKRGQSYRFGLWVDSTGSVMRDTRLALPMFIR
ncbi:hypothetical protein A2936_05685 [Candidatus Uhrbacteria bacterium RIFCSPLOWO2_01_FULL_47_25]|uniref:Uncharacterized protein n=1 Tax=Candidatus Uhrbacteria bacterium RIFCSPLOWO2_01_FULL_47_25 TaxID=1802402 RepID=A0A1F7URE2_9BACT|nr:MAG: hypothetical protein UX68_C0015G0015 [Parcubacteria group bacterium GW2011_GWA2_46_9]OGL80893.1 MAG: hypothetical protein A2936_05685 [Candidatus Uhrbacteria bacterium RIFCSPLOWO2_01_FULL_47_25]OGL84727.1 MAG: hypothetical protein A3I37_01185 [Candidatus Uhrbacteria bacterium RIFCSPLOWO2_02_FULL_46_19]